MARTTRDIIEIITAVLLGLVSVTTALGAYQAAVWAELSSDYRLVATQLRDRNLTELLTAELVSKQDSARIFDAAALEVEISLYPERAAELVAEQNAILASASPAMLQDWQVWRNSGFQDSLVPITQAHYESELFAQPASLQYSSFVAATLADAAAEKSAQVTIASVIFALALLLLGVAGVNASWRVAAGLTGGATLAYLAGLLYLVFTLF